MSRNIVVDGIEYVPKDSIQTISLAQNTDGLPYCVVRTYSAGVFAGYVKERTGQEAIVLQARRLWYWAGAASLSQLSQEGVSKPKECKFPCEVVEVHLTQVIEVIPCTEKAQKSINEVKVWSE